MSSITANNLPPSDSPQAGSLLADLRRELDDLCARADRAIHDAWVQHRDVRALLATPSHLQQQWWDRSTARFGEDVSKAVREFNVGVCRLSVADWRLDVDTARAHGDELAEQVWETLRADDYAPANFQKVEGGTTHRLRDALAALKGVRAPVEGGGGRG
ncbi:predicted protein [Chaetomium globosum CBS 148.51]|uniref:Uncharacterized protein n=1 Tax=Chaetomium globosum (strain ATCC 6205 / CBS 148.51 / DSM 1962 / NBRC 6347 / NRRL 1970) TaxID=306901 RepID=Q2GT31_CHAGB|nr:uncharacterized protein CHGG_08873 [Chaetomium globosum CBS 148.51]EAQ84859.1 predicted protein [Chaetomium globosum CBS 148.51]